MVEWETRRVPTLHAVPVLAHRDCCSYVDSSKRTSFLLLTPTIVFQCAVFVFRLALIVAKPDDSHRVRCWLTYPTPYVQYEEERTHFSPDHEPGLHPPGSRSCACPRAVHLCHGRRRRNRGDIQPIATVFTVLGWGMLNWYERCFSLLCIYVGASKEYPTY